MRIKLLILGIILFLVGGGMIEVTIMEWARTGLKEKAAGLGFGLPLLVGGALFTIGAILDAMPGKEERRRFFRFGNAKKENEMTEALQKYSLAGPLGNFRELLERFFQTPRTQTNDPIQGFVTQVYFQVLNLQKKRLAKKGIKLEIHTECHNYGNEFDLPLIWEKQYDDGKYRISLAKEQIKGSKTFVREGKKLYHREENQVAEYTLLTAFQRGGDRVVCPSCGNTTSRENLLDGCDYCKTKFMVEDLGERVQFFGFAEDYQVQDAKYRKNRDAIWKWGTLLGGVPGALLTIYFGIKTWFSVNRGEMEIGPFIAVIGTLIAMLFFAMVSAVLVFALLWFVLFPLVQGMFGLRYISKKWLQEAKEKEKHNEAVEIAIKQRDGRFSLQGFYGNIHNKLAAIHFADTPKEINAFSDCDLSSWLEKYQNVVDMEAELLRVEDYQIRQDIQEITLQARLKLLKIEGQKIAPQRETLELKLIKAAACKTQAVAGPEVTYCKGCGASVLLLEGKQCRYCQGSIPLWEHDWVIVSYQNQ